MQELGADLFVLLKLLDRDEFFEENEMTFVGLQDGRCGRWGWNFFLKWPWVEGP